MKKIKVQVCLGTTCYVMGAAQLQGLSNIIPQRYGDQVEVVSSQCLRLCAINWAESKAPYVKIDDEFVVEATVEKVLLAIDKKINHA